jgi:hypothetical protein
VKGSIARRPGISLFVVGVVVILSASLSGLTAKQSVPQTRSVHAVAGQVDDHSDNDTPKGPDKSTQRKGLLDADPTHPHAVVRGLASTVLSANRQIIQSGYHPVDPGQTSDLEVSCPTPFVVVNGGEQNTGQDVQLTENYPATSGAWHVQVHNDSTNQSASYQVYADCMSGLVGYQRITGPISDAAPGDYGGGYVVCPNGSEPLGGGYSIDKSDDVAINTSSYDGQGWSVIARNFGSSSIRVGTYAICATGITVTGSDPHIFSGSEYTSVESSCNSPADAFAGGWEYGTSTPDSHVTVTDSYPIPHGHKVWAHNHDGSTFTATLLCGMIP